MICWFRKKKEEKHGLDRVEKEEWSTVGRGVTREMNFTYDPAGRLRHAADDDTADSFTYDALGRVAYYESYGAHEFNAFVSLDATYDAAGNRTKLEAYVEGESADFATPTSTIISTGSRRLRRTPGRGNRVRTSSRRASTSTTTCSGR